MNKTRRFIPILMVAMVVMLAACSNKTNTARSRFWQAFNTKYNVYFHGKTNYDEQLKAMLDAYEDDYSQHLYMHPAEARSNPKAPQPSGSFERTIEKMEKAIALHSIKKKPKRKSGKNSDPKYREWMQRDEYNPFLHNAWYMLAKAQYMKGDFLDAAATFRYIARHFTWKPDLVQESQVREALCYCAMGWSTEADNVLAHVHLDEITNKRVRALANAAFADYHIKVQEPEQAIPYLSEAIKGFKGNEKMRMCFLLGQLYEDMGDKHNAYLAYKQAGSSSGSTYRTKFNARIKQSAVYEGANIASEVKALKRMTRYDRNKDYLDQIYYAIGNLYLSHNDTLSAIENYRLAAEKSTRNGVDKAISQITLGGIYFNRRQYDFAQPCYAEAIPLINEDYPNYKLLKKRSDVLDELAVYSQNVILQDSLLELAAMTPEEQHEVIAKIIEDLKKKEKEEAEEAERQKFIAEQESKGSQLQGSTEPSSYVINSDNSWYFYNTATKNAGKTQFQKAWGSRKLEDNWRRYNKSSFSFEEEEADTALMAMGDSVVVNENGDTVNVDVEALKRADDPHFEEYYLKQIPKTEEDFMVAHDIIQEGLYNMGTILKDKMEDYDAATYEFNRLLENYPDNTYRLDVYYNMYMMFMRNGQVADAQPYRDSILVNFPESKYGMAMQDPNYLENLKNMNKDQEMMYEAAYDNYLANNHNAVHEAYAEMMRKYPLSKIMPKFMFIDALSYLTQKDHEKFKETIKDMLQRYPQTDITPVASEIVKQLNQGRRLEGGGSNARGMLWSTRLSNDTSTQTLERTFTPFSEDNSKPQVFILLYPMDSVNGNMLLYEVARHNFNAFKVKDYDIEQMNFGTLGLLVVKGLDNFKEATNYRSLFEKDQTIRVPRQVHYVIISVDNFNLLLNEGRTFEDYFNYLEEKNDKEHSDLEKKELDEAEKKAQAEADAIAAANREKARIEAEQMEREAAEQARLDAEAKAQEMAEEQARLEAEAEEQARIEAEKKTQQETERKQIKANDYRNSSTTTTQSSTRQMTKEQERAEEAHLKQLEREAKAREKAEKKRQKEIEDSIKKEQKHERKLARIAEIAEQDSIEQAEKEKEKERDFRYKWREDSAKAAYKAAEQAKKDAKKAKEQARKDKAKERKELAKERQRERKEKAKERERERKEKAKERKEQAKAREQERKQRAKDREQERRDKADERKQQAKDKAEERKQQTKRGQQKQNDKDSANDAANNNSDNKGGDANPADQTKPDNKNNNRSVRSNNKND